MDAGSAGADFFLVSKFKNLTISPGLRANELVAGDATTGGLVLADKIIEAPVAIGGFDGDNGIGGDGAARDFFGINFGRFKAGRFVA